MEQAKGVGNWTPAIGQRRTNAGVSNVSVGGVQVAEVLVDTETGVVALHQGRGRAGLRPDHQQAGLRVAGGRRRHHGRQLRPVRGAHHGPRTPAGRSTRTWSSTSSAASRTCRKIIVHMLDMPERGVIGIGEPPTISTHAAIGNAVFNAIGVRVPHAPFTPERVLAALAAERREGIT